MRRLALLLFLSLASLFDDRQTACAQSIFRYNGLDRNGRNVCKTSAQRTETTQRTVSTVGHQRYTTRCGWFGWARCQRTRTVTRYRQITVTKLVWGFYLSCCDGWRRRGGSCTIPVCSGGCKHGTCIGRDLCRCEDGWRGSICDKDIDDCAVNNGGCHQRCWNRPGRGRNCGCNRGYSPDPNNKDRCIDYDECAKNGGICKCSNNKSIYSCGGRCVNKRGSFQCICGKGYRLVSKTICVDNNECLSRNGGCGHRCVNLLGSYNCSCLRGYRLASDQHVCLDVNECLSSNGYCEQRCSNQAGSYRCLCKKGFSLDGNRRTCSDINECQSYHGCDEIQGQCHNTYGSFYCTCSRGYTLGANKRACVDEDECAPRSVSGINGTVRLADCQQTCINTVGSFKCSCLSGYQILNDGKQCKDIDECNNGGHKCSHSCHNIEGSFRCSCPKGYKLRYDGRTCQALPCETLLPPSHGRLNCTGNVTGSVCSILCEPGYDIRGSAKRKCQPSSRWTGVEAFCKARKCDVLRPDGVGKLLKMPCDREYGSTCLFACRRGYFGVGIGKAKCALGHNSPTVVWEVAKFSCKEYQGCKINLCRNGGTCKPLGRKKFKCDCQGTGYKGTHCEIGVLYSPVFPRLKVGVISRKIAFQGRPFKGLKISVNSSNNLRFLPPPPYGLSSLQTKAEFAVKAVKEKGVEILSYKLAGASQKYYNLPEPSVVFIGEDVSPENSIYTKLKLRPGALPIGCHRINVSTEGSSCPAALSSTSLWRNKDSENPSTSGISHVRTGHGNYIPVSLLGVDFNYIPGNEAKTRQSLQKAFSGDFLQKDSIKERTTCFSLKLKLASISEFIQRDAFPTAFLQAASDLLPDWLSFDLAQNNDAFHIRNIAASLSKFSKNSNACANLPVPSKSFALCYTPLINYTSTIDVETVFIEMGRDTCFSIDLCTSAVYWDTGEAGRRMLKLSRISKNMERAGWDTEIIAVGFAPSGTLSASKLRGIVHLEHGYEDLNGFQYNIWIRGKLKVDFKSFLKISVEMEGQAFFRVSSLNHLLTEQFTRALNFAFEGSAGLNITSRALNQDFTIHTSSGKMIGKAQLGTSVKLSKKCNSSQGIFMTLSGIDNLFANSPLVNIVRPDSNQQLFLSIFHQITGGKQTGVANYRQLRRLLTNLRYGLRDLLDILEDLKPHLKIPAAAEGWITLTRQLINLVNKVRLSSRAGTKSVPVLNQIKRNVKELGSKLAELRAIITHLIFSFKTTPQSLDVTDLVTSLNDVLDALPISVELAFRKLPVRQSLQSVQLIQTGRVCIKKLCFGSMNITTELTDSSGCRKQHFAGSSSDDETAIVVLGTATKKVQLGKMLAFAKTGVLSLAIKRNKQELTCNFLSKITLLGFSKDVNVKLTLKKLTIHTEALLYNKYLTSMNITADVNNYGWDSLLYSVRGRMNKSSELVITLEALANNYTLQTVQTAINRVQNAEVALQNAKTRKEFFKKLINEKKDAIKRLTSTRTRTEETFHETRLRHESAKIDFNTTLFEFEKMNVDPCFFQDCKYLTFNSCIPKVCQRKISVPYIHQTCKERKKVVETEKIVETSTTASYENKKYKTSCGSGCSFLKFVGCNHWCERKFDGYTKTTYQNRANVLHKVKTQVKEFECQKESRTKFTGYGTVYRCCNQNKRNNVKVLDPKCVLHNAVCLDNRTIYRKILETENKTLFDSYINMMNLSERVSSLQMDLDKIRIQLEHTVTEKELVEARFRQQEYSVNAIDINKIKNRERRALDLGLRLKRSSLKKPIFVKAVEFNSFLSSNEKTSFSVTVLFDSINGRKRLQNIFMDFKNTNLKYAAKEIVKLLVGNKSLMRKKRSLRRANATVQKNDEETNKRAYYESSCLFSQNTKLFFADIMKSILFEATMTEGFNSKLLRGKRAFKGAVQMITAQYSPQEVKNRPMIRTFSEMMDLYHNPTEDPSQAWNQTLSSWRGLADTLPQARGISYCTAGASDCIDVVSDELLEMYSSIDDPKSTQLQQTIIELKEELHLLITQNFSVGEALQKVNRLKFLLSKSTDDEILCGKVPLLVSVSPRTFSVLEGKQLNLICRADSATAVLYTWYKDDKLVRKSKNGSLWFQRVTSTDSGAYKCMVSNHIGSTSSNYTLLFVESKPLIVQQSSDDTVIKGIEKPLHILCNVTGKPVPNIKWFFIPANSSITKTLKNETQTFVYKQRPDVFDSGYYYCEASNKHGTVRSKTVRVDVLNASIGDPRMRLSVDIKLSNSNNHSQITADQQSNLDLKLFFQDKLNRKRFLEDLAQAIQTNASSVTKLGFKSYTKKHINVVAVINTRMISKKNLPVDSVDSVSLFSRERVNFGKSLEALRKRIIQGSFPAIANGSLFKADPETLVAHLIMQKCPPGQYSHSNGYLCVNCAPGTYTATGGKCEKCEQGTYQPNQGQPTCIPCAQGFTTPNNGSTQRASCYSKDFNCSVPQTAAHTYLQYPKERKESFIKGDIIKWGCLPGYEAVGNTQQECLGPKWSNGSVTCRASCPAGWERFNSSCYVAIPNLTKRMADARAGCLRMGADLVDILSPEENNFVRQYATKKLGQTVYIWLGLQRDKRGMFTSWLTGKALSGFQNWFIGEPNNYGGSEDCAVMFVVSHRWNDVSCNFIHKPSTVCKKPKL